MRRGSGRFLPILSILLSGVLWGVISLFIRRLSAAGLSAMQICFVRLFFTAPIFLIAALVFSPSHMRIRLKDVWIFLGTGVVSVVLFNTAYFYTIIHSEASIAGVFLYTSPIFVMILSVLIFKEKITVKKVVAVVMTFVGCVFVSGITSGKMALRPIVAFIGVLSGLFYGLYTIFGTIGLKRYDPLTVTAYTFLFAFVAALPMGDVKGTFSILSATPSLWLWGAGIAVLCTVLPFFFYTVGLKKVEPSRATIIAAVEPLVAAVLGIVAFGERHNFMKILGIVFVLVAIILLNYPFEKLFKRKKGGAVAPILPPPEPLSAEEIPADSLKKEEIR